MLLLESPCINNFSVDHKNQPIFFIVGNRAKLRITSFLIIIKYMDLKCSLPNFILERRDSKPSYGIH